MRYNPNDTIAAIATAPGGAARAILRLAGPETIRCLEGCFELSPEIATDASLSQVDRAQVLDGQLRLDELERGVPCQLYLWPDQRSYTRSPMAELHMIGSPPLVEAALRTLCQHNARLAEPGEFTLRAFLAGRLDLTQAEAVLGVIQAKGDHELDVALRQLAGGLSGPLTELRNQLLDLLAHLEAGLDFVEEDIEFISAERLSHELRKIESQVDKLAEQMRARSETANAVRIVLTGNPNVGKSSLFNVLTQQPGAIVSDIPGTTRDYLSARIELEGIVCELIDTAGLEEIPMPDTISQAAQTMTAEQTRLATLRVLCLDGSRATDFQAPLVIDSIDQGSLVVLTKCDLPSNSEIRTVLADLEVDFLETSSETGAGIERLRSALRWAIERFGAGESEVVGVTAVRCRDSLRRAAKYLKLGREAVETATGEELVATELRSALDELGRVVGAVYTDDILDRIFSQFCIGK